MLQQRLWRKVTAKIELKRQKNTNMNNTKTAVKENKLNKTTYKQINKGRKKVAKKTLIVKYYKHDKAKTKKLKNDVQELKAGLQEERF